MTTNNRPAMQQLAILAIVIGFTIGNAFANDYSAVSQMARSGRLAEALARAEQFLAANPKDAQMRFIKGVVQSESGRTAEAITTFTRLTEEFPELPEPHNNLAVLYAGQGQFDKARNALEMAIRTNPSYSVAHENLGDVYAKLASQAYNKALQLNPANPQPGPKLALVRELFSTQQSRSAKAAAQTMSSATTAVATLPPPPNTGSPSKPSANAAPGAAPATAIATAPAGQLPATPAKPSSVPAGVSAPSTAAAPSKGISAPAAVSSPVNNTPVAVAQEGTGAAHAADAKDVEAAVHAWATAWSGKDMKGYLNSYDKSFTPPGGQSRNAWESDRKDRITGKASISVKISNLEIKLNGNKAVAKFRQDYKAGELNSSTRKTLEMQKSGDRWKIVREAVGA